MDELKLVVTLTARDVADLIEANVRFHLGQGVDHVIVTEHASTDDTADILTHLATTTGRVHVFRERSSGFDQSAVVNQDGPDRRY